MRIDTASTTKVEFYQVTIGLRTAFRKLLFSNDIDYVEQKSALSSIFRVTATERYHFMVTQWIEAVNTVTREFKFSNRKRDVILREAIVNCDLTTVRIIKGRFKTRATFQGSIKNIDGLEFFIKNHT